MRAVRWAKGLEKLLVPIDSIKQHPQNPNNGDVESIIDSIQRNGFNTVITVDAQTNEIIAGNHRLQALCALGITEAPVVYTERQTDSGDIRYLIADNATGKKARMDEMQEAHLLTMLRRDTAEGLEGTGVTEDEYIDLIERLAANQKDEPEVDGSGWDQGVQGIFEVTVALDDEKTRDNLLNELKLRFPGKVRWLNY